MDAPQPSPLAVQALKPGATLGVLGGGQLARMWAQAAHTLGYRTCAIDPDAHSPVAQVGARLLPADYLDATALAQLAQLCQAVTTEFENVPATALAQLAEHLPVSPQAHAVAVAQDRVQEKTHLQQCGVAVAPHAVLTSLADVQTLSTGLLPGILKTARGGYDGKGQWRVANLAELQAAWQDCQSSATPNAPRVCVLERLLPLAGECSVVVARSRDGQMVHLPLQTNLHRGGILAVTEVLPSPHTQAWSEPAVAAARQVAQQLDYVGVLCVEFFVLQDHTPEQQQLGSWVVNEIAPRPHNSGHHSLDSCDVSQFELQVRCMAGLPLVQPRQHSAAIMLNLLGELWASGEPPWAQLLALPGCHLHLYGKREARAGRKMGHLTITAADAGAAKQLALQAAELLGIARW